MRISSGQCSHLQQDTQLVSVAVIKQAENDLEVEKLGSFTFSLILWIKSTLQKTPMEHLYKNICM